MKNIKLFKRSDLIIIIAVCVLCVILLIPMLLKSNYLTAEIYLDGKIEYEIDLNSVEKSYVITLNSSPSTQITVEKGRICFSYAECKDKLCVKCGWLDSNGQTAACLPSKAVIVIKGSDKAPDMLTY